MKKREKKICTLERQIAKIKRVIVGIEDLRRGSISNEKK